MGTSQAPTAAIIFAKSMQILLQRLAVFFAVPCYAQLLSRVQLFVTAWTVAPQAVLSIGFSRQEYWSHLRLFTTLRTVALQAPLSMKFSSQECWVGLPFPSPGDLSDPRIKPRSAELQADSLPSEPPGKFSISKFISFLDIKRTDQALCPLSSQLHF